MPAENLAMLGKSAGTLTIAVMLFAVGFFTGQQAPKVTEFAQELPAASLALSTTTATTTISRATTTVTAPKQAVPKKPAVTAVAKSTSTPVIVTYTGTSAPWAGALISGTYSPFLEFVRSDFDRALREGKLVVAFFYDSENGDAIELIRLTNAFAKRTDGGVAGFKVDLGAKADSAEREMAALYGIETSNSKLLLRNNTILMKAVEVWNEARITKEIEEQW